MDWTGEVEEKAQDENILLAFRYSSRILLYQGHADRLLIINATAKGISSFQQKPNS